MAFVFRSERNFDYQKDSNVDSIPINEDKDKINKVNSDIIAKLKQKEKKKKLNKESINSNISNKNNPPFSSTSEKVTLQTKEDTPGPGSYNINKLYYNRGGADAPPLILSCGVKRTLQAGFLHHHRSYASGVNPYSPS